MVKGDVLLIEDADRWSREKPLDSLNAVRETVKHGSICPVMRRKPCSQTWPPHRRSLGSRALGERDSEHQLVVHRDLQESARNRLNSA